jgi:uncharacterized protein (DUF1800 family)
MRIFQLFGGFCLSLVLVGCGGGGTSSSSDLTPSSNPENTPSSKVETATFVDSPVIGISYDNGDGRIRVTDSEGKFKYYPKRKVKFYLDDIFLGEALPVDKSGGIDAPTKKVLTPFELVGTKVLNENVIKLSMLLISLDSNDDPDDGIEIDLRRLNETETIDNIEDINLSKILKTKPVSKDLVIRHLLDSLDINSSDSIYTLDENDIKGGKNSHPNNANGRKAPSTSNLSKMEIPKYIPQGKDFTYDIAFRFLLKTTFGPTQSSIKKVQEMGAVAWLEEQLNQTYDKNDSLTYQLLRMGKTLNDFAYPHEIEEYLAEDTTHLLPTYGSDQVKYRDYFLSSWFREVFMGVKQVHMRVAYALSQIVVASNSSGVFNGQHHALAAYYDVIKKNAFGKYGDLLKEISTNPAMGYYLTFYGNREKYQNSRGEWVYPDENYAREVMQLFSISPFLLNMDGTKVLDSNGAPIPSYTQDDVNELARVFTGLDFRNARGSFGNTGIRRADMIHKMNCINKYHDAGSKSVLGKSISGGGDCYQDVNKAIDILMSHQNTAPFISKKLIMRLVKSNPSPEYVQRVAEVFEKTDGDIKATVRAIYLDREFWDDLKNKRITKFKEPIMAFTQMARAFHVRPLPKWHIYLDSPSSPEVRHKKATVEDTDLFWVSNPSGAFGEGPTLSKTVFNFYSDDYVPSDNYFRDNGLVAPEVQIQTDGMLVAYHNYMYNVLFNEKNYALNTDNGVNLYAPYQFVIYKDMKEFGDALDGVFHPDKFYFDLSEYIKAVENALRPEMDGKDLEEILKKAHEQEYIFSEEARKKAISNILDILDERLLGHSLDDRLREVIVEKYYKRLKSNEALSKNFRKFYVLVLQETIHMVLISDDYKVE